MAGTASTFEFPSYAGDNDMYSRCTVVFSYKLGKRDLKITRDFHVVLFYSTRSYYVFRKSKILRAGLTCRMQSNIIFITIYLSHEYS